MNFGGFQKLTLLDFPGKVACTLFTVGCNFRCPFCHNGGLIDDVYDVSYSENEILSFLKKRVGVLEGVCITGGEPLMHKELPEFLGKVKELGYPIKLDTNGTLPRRLKDVVNGGLVDYVAMDIKNSFDKYPATAGVEKLDISKIEESIEFLLGGRVDYEFRTTVVAELHSIDDIEMAAKRIRGAKKYYLQNFVNSEFVLCENLNSVPIDVLRMMQSKAAQYVDEVSLRGV